MGLLDHIYPKNCFSCSASGANICSKCIKKVGKAKSFCPVCNKPSIDGFAHSGCKKVLGMDRLVSVWKYEGVVKEALLKLKFRFAKDVAEELAEKYSDRLDKNLLPKSAYLIPIPIHLRRKKWRGFNQAEEMGKILATRLSWDYLPDLITRTRHTRPQTELERGERKKNVRGAFSVSKSYVFGKNVRPLVLFDDVWTTGSTLVETTKTIKRKNKELEVIAMTICS